MSMALESTQQIRVLYYFKVYNAIYQPSMCTFLSLGKHCSPITCPLAAWCSFLGLATCYSWQLMGLPLQIMAYRWDSCPENTWKLTNHKETHLILSSYISPYAWHLMDQLPFLAQGTTVIQSTGCCAFFQGVMAYDDTNTECIVDQSQLQFLHRWDMHFSRVIDIEWRLTMLLQ